MSDSSARAAVLSPHERQRERWCKYAAGVTGGATMSDRGTSPDIDDTVTAADALLAEEEQRFGAEVQKELESPPYRIRTVFGECARLLELLPDAEQRMRVLKALTIIFEE